ncbi:hypothetical protein [Vibrio sp. D431a]|uniref:hypothetical protein n=1 Tax=Vibrio sp. D431a TaxID=2837388 RepID=UPI002552E4A9|nr:hypothetical protein [Vibrio sp. D431a]MDK9793752.1 hypothetical protein [Vibrio sp. D431a]
MSSTKVPHYPLDMASFESIIATALIDELKTISMSHANSSVMFTINTDEKIIYASVKHSSGLDRFQDCNSAQDFLASLSDAYANEKQALISLEESFGSVASTYSFSDFNNNANFTIKAVLEASKAKSTNISINGKAVTAQEEMNILASLRILQDMIETGELSSYRNLPHFDDHEPLSAEQIDELCEKCTCTTPEQTLTKEA